VPIPVADRQTALQLLRQSGAALRPEPLRLSGAIRFGPGWRSIGGGYSGGDHGWTIGGGRGHPGAMNRRTHRRAGRPTRLLHQLEALLTVAGPRQGPHPAGASDQASERRRQQRLTLAQRLLDPLPVGLRAPGQAADIFWRALRWGGGGLLLGWILQRLAALGS
jgi:hypothetical protein